MSYGVQIPHSNRQISGDCAIAQCNILSGECGIGCAITAELINLSFGMVSGLGQWNRVLI